MKPQDILLIALLCVLFLVRKPRLTTSIGLISLVISALLFAKHIFFTAQHLTYFAAATFLLAVIQYIWTDRYENRH